MKITVNFAKPQDHERVILAYDTWGYRGSITSEDTILMAERVGKLVGLVRMVPEEGTIVLRGMYVDPMNRGSGIGLHLLLEATSWLGARECYCVPYSHLLAFYQKGGFQECDISRAPQFLQDRVRDYLKRGREVLLMYRPSH